MLAANNTNAAFAAVAKAQQALTDAKSAGSSAVDTFLKLSVSITNRTVQQELNDTAKVAYYTDADAAKAAYNETAKYAEILASALRVATAETENIKRSVPTAENATKKVGVLGQDLETSGNAAVDADDAATSADESLAKMDEVKGSLMVIENTAGAAVVDEIMKKAKRYADSARAAADKAMVRLAELSADAAKKRW